MADTLTAPSPSSSSLHNPHSHHLSSPPPPSQSQQSQSSQSQQQPSISISKQSPSDSEMADGSKDKGKDTPPSRKRSISSLDVDLTTNDEGQQNEDSNVVFISSRPATDSTFNSTPTTTGQKKDDVATKVGQLTLDGKQPPAKKKKLTPEEKAQREKDKAEKEKQKEIEKEKREKERAEKEKEKAEKEKQKAGEKAEKDKERAEREKERAEKKRQKDEEAKKKAEEAKKKADEKAKKERSQLKIGSFFKAPGASSTKASSNGASSTKDEMDTDTVVDLTKSPAATPVKKQQHADKTDYQRNFHDFFVKPNVEMAKTNYFIKDEAAVSVACERLDEYLKHSLSSDEDGGDGDNEMEIDGGAGLQKPKRYKVPQPLPKGHFASILEIPPNKLKRRGIKQRYTTRQILSGLNSSPEPIFANGEEESKTKKRKPDYLSLLKALPIKHLHFAEDVRPPYKGTFTRVPTVRKLLLAKDPCIKGLPGINYDYDSELEWIENQDEGDGEELLSEDDDDAMSEDSGEEMDEFLDDGDEDQAVINARRNVLGPLEAKCTGLVWEEDQNREKWEPFRMGFLIENLSAPINPFDKSYWETPKAVPSKSNAKNNAKNTESKSLPSANALTNMLGVAASADGSMAPPATKPGGAAAGKADGSSSGSKKSTKNVPRVADEDMDKFKEELLKWDTLNKIGIVEVLRKMFPKYSKESIKATLEDVAVRSGAKEADKKWVLIGQDS